MGACPSALTNWGKGTSSRKRKRARRDGEKSTAPDIMRPYVVVAPLQVEKTQTPFESHRKMPPEI